MIAGLMVGLGRPRPAALDDLLRSALGAELTYDHPGSTLTTTTRSLRYHRLRLGRGEQAFDDGRRALREWVAHRGIGAAIHPAGVPIEVGATLLVVLRVGPVWLVAPTRIVVVVDEDSRFGFAYGTLPGHPERGEESFVIERDHTGEVHAAITVDAEPGVLVTQALTPFTLLAQRLAVRGYLKGLADASRPGD